MLLPVMDRPDLVAVALRKAKLRAVTFHYRSKASAVLMLLSGGLRRCHLPIPSRKLTLPEVCSLPLNGGA